MDLKTKKNVELLIQKAQDGRINPDLILKTSKELGISKQAFISNVLEECRKGELSEELTIQFEDVLKKEKEVSEKKSHATKKWWEGLSLDKKEKIMLKRSVEKTRIAKHLKPFLADSIIRLEDENIDPEDLVKEFKDQGLKKNEAVLAVKKGVEIVMRRLEKSIERKSKPSS